MRAIKSLKTAGIVFLTVLSIKFIGMDLPGENAGALQMLEDTFSSAADFIVNEQPHR